jgi:hypothetical protein
MESAGVFEKLFQNTFDSVNFDQSAAQYLNLLVPNIMDPLEVEQKRFLTLDKLRSLPAKHQILCALAAAKVLQFKRLKELCTKSKVN